MIGILLGRISCQYITCEDLYETEVSQQRPAKFDECLQAKGSFDWVPPAEFSIVFDNLKSELFIGGVYVRLFLKNPSFPLRAPKGFLEGLLKTYLSDVADSSVASQERAIVLSAAAAELLRHHHGLADHAVTLGYVTCLLKLLSTRLEQGNSSNTVFQSAVFSLDKAVA